MKTVTSEDNLTGYLLPDQRADLIDIASLNRKIKAMKSALKLNQRHNKDLHQQIKDLANQNKVLKQSHQLQVLHLENECRKYKQLYQMLAEDYDLRGLELKECRKRLKRIEVQQTQNAGLSPEEAEETTREYREAILKQERELSKVREENRLLYQQLYEKAAKTKELEQLLSRGHSGCKDQKDKSFLLKLRTALEGKNEQFEKVLQEKNHLVSTKTQLEKDYSELEMKFIRTNAELEIERKSLEEVRERLGKEERERSRVGEELKMLSLRYSELLGFSYELQKDMERQLQVALKELSRKDTSRQ